MLKIISTLFSVFYYLAFGSCLIVFHILQWITFYGFGYSAHKITVDYLNFMIMRCLNLLGTRFDFNHPYSLPTDRPIIFVANHQSTYDIPPLIWHLRRHHAKFISKKELGKGIPSVSFNLRHGGSVLIDRKKTKQSLVQIQEFGKQLTLKKHSAVIFPEGSRSRDGQPKPFRKGGLLHLMETMPNALVVPISIGNSWKLAKYNYFPMPMGIKIKFTVHPPLEIPAQKPEELIDRIESTIKQGVGEFKYH
ncbi:MAG: lysophospholipid acyltransferase family protein [Flavobacteriaceae bacterium]